MSSKQLDLFNKSKHKKMAISGCSGMIGSYLEDFFTERGWEVVPISKKHLSSKDELQKAISGSGVVINLAGESIANGRWTKKKKERITESRISTTKKLTESMNEIKNPPELLISVSGAGYYGAMPGYVEGEGEPPGDDFLANVCIKWEAAAKHFNKGRVVIPRLGVVISNSGGFFKRLKTLGKFFILGKVGDGNQIMSWVSIEDIAEVFLTCIEDKEIEGPINLTAPNPISNKDCINEIAHHISRPVLFPLPVFFAKFLFGEKASALLMANQFIHPKKLLDLEYEFKHKSLSDYLTNL